MRSSRSKTTTSCPARASCCAAASPAGPEPTTATRLPVRTRGGLRHERPPAKHVVGDRALDGLDGHRLVADVEHARRLARRRAHAPGHLGEVVRRVEAPRRLVDAAPVHEVVPLRDEVPERAALVAERDAAVHAARRLRADLRLASPGRRARASRARAPRPGARPLRRATAGGSPSDRPSPSRRPLRERCEDASPLVRHDLHEPALRPTTPRTLLPRALRVCATCSSTSARSDLLVLGARAARGPPSPC